jgi:pyrroloquinoline quinone biosynthesis protein B
MPRLTAIVLGSAAGGGVPQWNCSCRVCQLARAGDPRVPARTQASIAVSGDGERWILLNAAPDLRAQMAATPALQPKRGPRASPIEAVVLTGAEVDQIAGLLHLRESQSFALYGTAAVLSILEQNPMLDVLSAESVTRRPVRPGVSFELPGGLAAQVFPVPGKRPLYLEDERPEIGVENGANAGVEIRAAGARFVFVPGATSVSLAMLERMQAADVVCFDGTLYQDDEMIAAGVGSKTGYRIGHMPIDGESGSLAALAGVKARRIYIHLNNTNPVLIGDSPERRRVESAGFEIGYDGMEIVL